MYKFKGGKEEWCIFGEVREYSVVWVYGIFGGGRGYMMKVLLRILILFLRVLKNFWREVINIGKFLFLIYFFNSNRGIDNKE